MIKYPFFISVSFKIHRFVTHCRKSGKSYVKGITYVAFKNGVQALRIPVLTGKSDTLWLNFLTLVPGIVRKLAFRNFEN